MTSYLNVLSDSPESSTKTVAPAAEFLGRVAVFSQNLASATLARALAAMAETIPISHTAPQCLLASAEGDDHTPGLALAEVCLREAGWAARWVGAPTRTAHLVEHVRAGEVQMVALSASLRSRDGPALASQARRVGAACRVAGAALVLGGAGRWPETPSFGVRLRTWEEFARVTKARAETRS